MLRCIAIAWLLLALLGVYGHADEAPQHAVVAAVEAEVRSGPSLRFFATDRLINGTDVEVYKQMPNGWCAIRPPAGSFSYVPVEAVQATTTPNVAICVQAGIKTRVGSKLNEQFNVRYVSLHAGEHLQLLSEPICLGSQQRQWYRIAPPAGEFRWMRKQDLRFIDNALPAQQVAVSAESSEPPSFPTAASETSTPLADLTSPALRNIAIAASDTNEQLVTTTIPSASREQMMTTPIPRPEPQRAAEPSAALSSGDIQPVTHAQAEAPVHTRSVAAMPNRESALSQNTAHSSAWTVVPDGATTDPNWELAELELQLSQQVTQNVESWQLSAIAARTNAMVRRLNDSNVRRDAERLLQRTQEFAALQRRHQLLMGENGGDGISLISAVTSVPEPATSLADVAAAVPIPPIRSVMASRTISRRSTTPLNPRAIARPTIAAGGNGSAHAAGFVGRGWLVPVITERTDLPRFALADEKGRVTSFVAAVPGLNLRRFERHEVGIVGREQVASPRTSPYLLAERIVVLDR